ncbi:MAG: aldolase/citrate lyase family protein [bacterium]|nr:aldolase/citrate lyase family protein [bacterium]MDE0287821.1 aldolase/citrate lyase family protein [bacterium]MDE0438312.1 aldolase/citrate lyase family protein [bacterium]
MSAMRPNPLRARWAAGEPAIGGWLTIPNQLTAEVTAAADLDYICIDMQHGLIDYSDVLRMLTAVTASGVTPIVRVPENSIANISTVLDAGAIGVIVPLVNTVAEAASVVAACRYPPLGERSYGATRAAAVEGPDYYDRANDEVVCIPMIETVEAVDDLDGILSIPGIDVAYVGPSDLSISMGYWPGTTAAPFLAMLDRIVEACDRHGVVPAIQASPSTAADRLARGFRMVTVVTDILAYRVSVDLAIAQARGTDPGGPGAPLY